MSYRDNLVERRESLISFRDHLAIRAFQHPTLKGSLQIYKRIDQVNAEIRDLNRSLSVPPRDHVFGKTF